MFLGPGKVSGRRVVEPLRKIGVSASLSDAFNSARNGRLQPLGLAYARSRRSRPKLHCWLGTPGEAAEKVCRNAKASTRA